MGVAADTELDQGWICEIARTDAPLRHSAKRATRQACNWIRTGSGAGSLATSPTLRCGFALVWSETDQYMDPYADRGISLDPDNRDRHGYVGANPISFVDLDGHAKQNVGGSIVTPARPCNTGVSFNCNGASSGVRVDATNDDDNTGIDAYTLDGANSSTTVDGVTTAASEVVVRTEVRTASLITQTSRMFAISATETPDGGHIVSACGNAMYMLGFVGPNGSACGHVGVRVEGKNPLKWHWDAGATASPGGVLGAGVIADAGLSFGVTRGTANVAELSGGSWGGAAGASYGPGVQGSVMTSKSCGGRNYTASGGVVGGVGAYAGAQGQDTSVLFSFQDRCS